MDKPTVIYDIKSKPDSLKSSELMYLFVNYNFLPYDSRREGDKPFIFNFDPTKHNFKDFDKLTNGERNSIIKLARKITSEMKQDKNGTTD